MTFTYPDKLDAVLVDAFCNGTPNLTTSALKEAYARPKIQQAIVDFLADQVRQYRIKVARQSAQATIQAAELAVATEIPTLVK